MPTFYEGEPIAVLKETLSENDYAHASWQMKRTLFPMCRPSVRGGLCATAVLAFAALIPAQTQSSMWWAPVCGILLSLGLGVYFYFVQPKYDLMRGAEIFRRCRLLAEETTISIYRDSVVLENRYEKLLEYWTDFRTCIESGEYIIVCGGRERDLLIIVKRELPPETVLGLSAHFENTFAARYRKIL